MIIYHYAVAMKSLKLFIFCSACCNAVAVAQTQPDQDFSLHHSLRQHPYVLSVAHSNQPLIEAIPDDALTSNAKFITLNSENDFFGNGTDKDYTNGIRISYMDVGAEQPFWVDWLDSLSPTFNINKTTAHYFSFGQNLYTPQDITESNLNLNDRPYAAFTYVSGGLSTLTDNHIDNAELTLGWVGPSAGGKPVQTEYHKLIHADKPMGWSHQLRDEPGIILSMERQWPQYLSVQLNHQRIRLTPHAGLTLGNIYTYANVGFTLLLTPNDGSLQAQPPRVRPAIPGSGFFLSSENDWSWMAYLGFDARIIGRNIFLDGNTWKESHSIDKRHLVFDASAGVAANYKNFRVGYSLNWRSKEFNSPLAKNQIFGALSLSYRY